jgi:hypothetical protein
MSVTNQKCPLVIMHSVMLEALADGGVMMGLPRDVATELAAQGIILM